LLVAMAAGCLFTDPSFCQTTELHWSSTGIYDALATGRQGTFTVTSVQGHGLDQSEKDAASDAHGMIRELRVRGTNQTTFVAYTSDPITDDVSWTTLQGALAELGLDQHAPNRTLFGHGHSNLHCGV